MELTMSAGLNGGMAFRAATTNQQCYCSRADQSYNDTIRRNTQAIEKASWQASSGESTGVGSFNPFVSRESEARG
jgi:hypothetical protein